MSLLKLDDRFLVHRSPSFRDRPPLPLHELKGPRGIEFPPTAIKPRYWLLGDCTVILTHDGHPFGWHLSIAHPHRYPHWDEIAEARYRLMEPGITGALTLPPQEEYINIHENCFHLCEIPDIANLMSMYEAWRIVTQKDEDGLK